jgi:hypothetical protein
MALAALAAFTLTASARWKPVAILSRVLIIVLGLSFLGVLSASLWNLARRRWAKGIANLVAVPVCGAATVVAFGSLMLASMFGPSEDGFGKDIVIPPDMKVESPLEPRPPASGPATDGEGLALIASFSTNGADGVSGDLSVDLPALDEFAGPNRALLFRHLASSAKWFVTKERGKVYACRRCVVNGRWQNSLNGYYTASDFNTWGDRRFQFRIILGPNGPVMSRPWQAKATMAKTADRVVRLKAIDDRKYAQGVESYLVLESRGAALEIFEQSPSHARIFTSLALKQISGELQSVLSSPVARQRGFDPSLMPPESIRPGEADIRLENGMLGGIYFVYAHVNPGEAGYAYLKVFEATRNLPLSGDRITDRSTEYVGWSDDPKEQFLYSSEITVYEGDWGVYYPARFELWFVPDSGKSERKLVEKIFKVEGWQR